MNYLPSLSCPTQIRLLTEYSEDSQLTTSILKLINQIAQNAIELRHQLQGCTLKNPSFLFSLVQNALRDVKCIEKKCDTLKKDLGKVNALDPELEERIFALQTLWKNTKEFAVDINEIYNLHTWCEEKHGTTEYRHRLNASEKIRECYVEGKSALDLSQGQLSSLPHLHFPNLRQLDLSGNQLNSLPELTLPNLQVLRLDGNQLTFLSNLNFPKLKQLYLSGNQLNSLPELTLPNLQVLYLSDNHLSSLPNLNFPKLKQLYLNGNRLSSLPELTLPNLQIFHLNNNQITFLPDCNFPSLQVFRLDSNQLTSLPSFKASRLRQLYLGNNLF